MFPNVPANQALTRFVKFVSVTHAFLIMTKNPLKCEHKYCKKYLLVQMLELK